MRNKNSLETVDGFSKSIRNRTWFFLNILFTIIYLYWRLMYTVPLNNGLVSKVAGITLMSIELIGALEAFIHYWNMYTVKNYPLPKVPENEFPDVDVFIATYNESNDILYKTINGCLHMDYPDKSKVHIYVCDDNRRPEVKKLATEMGVNYLDRPDNKHAKAGNLNNAMKFTSSPLIVTFDADMIPNHNFLMKTIPYFVETEIKNRTLEDKDKIKLGFVQSPQAFYNPDLYQFYLFSENRIPNEQDYFYRDVQVSRNKSNSVIYGGSNTVLSRSALEEIGGFYTDSITEDFATGILIQKAKYKCIAINEILASGLSPTALKELIQQRVRWARGVINTSRKVGFVFTRKLTVAQKLNYCASMWYWYSPFKIFTYIMSPILFAVFGYVVIECTLPEILLFWLPMYISSNVTLRMLSGNIRTTKWSRIYETVLFPFLFFPVLLETFGISMKKFKVTQKGEVTSEKGKNFIYSIPFLVFIVLSVIGIYNSVKIMFVTASINPIVILFWLTANMFSLVMALFFIQGRAFMRKSERVSAKIDCTINNSYETFKCTTRDFSETGVSVSLKSPHFIDDAKDVELQLKSDRYEAKFRAKVVHVSKLGDIWKYAFEITDLPEAYKADYMQLLYDRVPTLPLTLNESLSSFDDLRINVAKRAVPLSYANRRLARMDIYDTVKISNSRTIKIINFNYKFIAFEGDINDSSLKITLYNGLELLCSKDKNIRDNIQLYVVENMEDIYQDKVKRKLLDDWINLKRTEENLIDKEDENKSEDFLEMDAV